MIPLLVLGIGNPILCDDGVGPRAITALAERGGLPAGARLLDGGTGGLSLLPAIESAARVLVIDAVDVGGRPGEVRRLTGNEIPQTLRRRLTPHEVGLDDLLALCRLRGTLPAEVVLLGVQVASLEVRAQLSPEVEERFPAVLEAARAEARRLAAGGEGGP